MTSDRKMLTPRLPRPLYEELQRLSGRSGLSLNELAVQALAIRTRLSDEVAASKSAEVLADLLALPGQGCHSVSPGVNTA